MNSYSFANFANSLITNNESKSGGICLLDYS